MYTKLFLSILTGATITCLFTTCSTNPPITNKTQTKSPTFDADFARAYDLLIKTPAGPSWSHLPACSVLKPFCWPRIQVACHLMNVCPVFGGSSPKEWPNCGRSGLFHRPAPPPRSNCVAKPMSAMNGDVLMRRPFLATFSTQAW